MATGWKTVRVFISSTFRDMHAERDHLVRVVIPELKERCRKIHVHVIDVDLRWGVTEADAEHGKALDICLDEIDSCRPYFLGILGHRYGFVPEGQRHSITAQEIYHGVLHGGVPKQVVDLRKILEEKLEGQTLSKEQKDCLARCYRWDADKRKHLLREDVTQGEVDIIRSVFDRYSIYQKDRSFFFFRSDALTRRLAGTNIADYFEQKQEDQDKLKSLKNEIADARLPHYEYADIEAFGQHALDTLWKRIEAESEQTPSEETDWLAEEDELHGLFMADRTRRFVGRRELLDRMHAFSERNDEPSLLVITGEPGCGKSALMARFAEEALRRNPNRLILSHFVGASPSSTSLRRMLHRLSTHLNRVLGVHESAPEDIKDLLRLFPEILKKAGEYRPLLIIMDAVNQLEKTDRAHSMGWIPQGLPPNVRLVISTLAGEACDALLRRRIKPQKEVVKGLTVAELREVTGTYLREIRHEFPNREAEASFFRKVEHGNPLYILVALDELRVFGRFEELGRKIDELPDNLPALFDQVLERVESDFTSALVRDCMSFIACGRYGMPAEELQVLLKTHSPCLEPSTETLKLPDMLWRRLYRSLGAYLFDRAGFIDFFHGQLKDAVRKRYLREERNRDAAHQAIANYLAGRWREPNARALDELPYQQIKARNWLALEGVLCDLEFIELKCHENMTYDLVADYESALVESEAPDTLRAKLKDFLYFMNAQSHILRRKSWLTFQQAANEPDSTEPARAARARTEAGLERRPWLQYVNKAQSHSACLMTLTGHEDMPIACSFSPDGRRIVSAGLCGTLILWDSKTGAKLAVLCDSVGYSGSSTVPAYAFSPDGQCIVSKSLDKTQNNFNNLKIWHAETGTELMTLSGHEELVNACVFSPDGQRIVSASDDGTLKIWDVETGAQITTLAGHKSGVQGCAISSDGRRVVSASQDKTLKLWDAETAAGIATLKGHTESVQACAFSPDDRRIVSASADRTLKIWNVETGAVLATLKADTEWVNACAFSPDGRCVASNERGLWMLWDARTGAKLAEAALAFSPDSRRIIYASSNCSLKIRDAETGAELATLAGHQWEVKACAFSSDGRRIVSASSDKTLKLWDGETGAELATLKGHTGGVNKCAFSPDGRRIVSASPDETLKLWDGETGAELATLKGHTGGVNGCAFSPDGRRIVSASWDKTLKLWYAETGGELATLKGHRGGVTACAFSPDGRRIVSGDEYGWLILWNAKTGAKRDTFLGHGGYVTACQFSPDGRRIVSASYDKSLKIWDARPRPFLSISRLISQGKGELLRFGFHAGRVRACTFSPGGDRIASASEDGTLKFWDVKVGPLKQKLGEFRGELATIIANKEGVTACSISPDGCFIVSALAYDLELFDNEKRVLICEFPGLGLSLAWSPGGYSLAAVDSLGRISILRLHNVSLGPIFVTPRQHVLSWRIPWRSVYFGCPGCQMWSDVPASALGTVIPCPRCGKPLKLNSFTINADWRPIAEAWKKNE